MRVGDYLSLAISCMMIEHVETANMKAWTRSLIGLIEDCGIEHISQADAILRLDELLAQGPIELLCAIGTRTSRDRTRSLVEMGEFEAAAMAMLGSRCGYLLSRSPGGRAAAMVTIEGFSEETSFFANRPSIALVGAIGAAILQGDPRGSAVDDVMRPAS